MRPAKGKKLAINLSGNSIYRKTDDRWVAYFPLLDIYAESESKEGSHTALVSAISQYVNSSSDVSAKEKWRRFCEENIIEIDLTSDEEEQQRRENDLINQYPATEFPAVTDASFDATVASSRMTLIDFWAPWCHPCALLAPVLYELASRHTRQLDIYALNVDDELSTVDRLGIRGVPTLIAFRDGQEVTRMHGMKTLEQIEAELFPSGTDWKREDP